MTAARGIIVDRLQTMRDIRMAHELRVSAEVFRVACHLPDD
jgi:hypothetical protein